MSKDLSYQDVMLYPGQEKEVLYCGWFKGLQFDGAGTLFYSNPQRKIFLNALPSQPAPQRLVEDALFSHSASCFSPFSLWDFESREYCLPTPQVLPTLANGRVVRWMAGGPCMTPRAQKYGTGSLLMVSQSAIFSTFCTISERASCEYNFHSTELQPCMRHISRRQHAFVLNAWCATPPSKGAHLVFDKRKR